MTIEDFFWLSDDEYAARIRSYDLPRLRKQEINKYRQVVAAGGTIGGGIASTLITGPIGLAASGYGLRRMDVAERKYDMICAELTRRGQTLHEPRKRDYLIPMAVGVVGAGIGPGIDSALSHAASAIPTPDLSSTIMHPEVAIGAFQKGVEAQMSSMQVGASSLVDHGVMPMHSIVPVPSGSHLVQGAYAGGISAAAGAEHTGLTFLATSIGEKAADAVLEYNDGRHKGAAQYSKASVDHNTARPSHMLEKPQTTLTERHRNKVVSDASLRSSNIESRHLPPRANAFEVSNKHLSKESSGGPVLAVLVILLAIILLFVKGRWF